MKFWTVGAVHNICCGHGDYRNFIFIGMDDNGKFPPLFRTQHEAAAWVDDNKPYNYRIVTMELKDEDHTN